jgi:hypothetical protein
MDFVHMLLHGEHAAPAERFCGRWVILEACRN